MPHDCIISFRHDGTPEGTHNIAYALTYPATVGAAVDPDHDRSEPRDEHRTCPWRCGGHHPGRPRRALAGGGVRVAGGGGVESLARLPQGRRARFNPWA